MTQQYSSEQKACAAAIVINSEGAICLQERDDDPDIVYPGHISLFAGSVNPDETPFECIKRELAEEFYSDTGELLEYSEPVYLGCEFREEVGYFEYIFYVHLKSPTEHLRSKEGMGVYICQLADAIYQANMAPHHRSYIKKYGIGISDLLQAKDTTKNGLYKIIDLGVEKDLALLNTVGGYVLQNGNNFTAALQPKEPPRFIALLNFISNVVRGNHFHLRKVEYMIFVQGGAQIRLANFRDPTEFWDEELSAGQMIVFYPGCVHAIDAHSGDAVAVETSPQEFDMGDVHMCSIK